MENKTSNNILRILVVGGIIAILVFLSIGIVRVIPRALNALASASVSIGSIFKGETATTTTPGFVVSTSTQPEPVFVATTTPEISITDIINPPPTTSKPTPTYPSNTNYTPTGNPDLAVTITSRGIINPANGQFIETNNFTTNDTVIVKFKIENRGTSTTGLWNLRVNMPSSNSLDRIRDINGNGSLPAGSAIVGQATFDKPSAGSNTIFSIAVAPQTSVRELSDANNIATSYFNVTGNTSNTGYPADLTGQLIAVGILDANNNFVATNNPRVYDRIAIKFRVSNTGGSATGAWNFRVVFSNGTQEYTSYESALLGNTSLTYTLSVSNAQPGYNVVNVYLDSGNNVIESNEGNNVISASFNTTY